MMYRGPTFLIEIAVLGSNIAQNKRILLSFEILVEIICKQIGWR